MPTAASYRLYLSDTPIGPLTLSASDSALTRLDFGAPEPALVPAQANPLLQHAAQQLTQYFSGERQQFDLPLAPEGTAFQQQVWQQLQALPFGTTCSYGELAAKLGKPNAARAIGMANNRNPLPILIPCHRVVGADGALVGYAGGLAIKQQLLQLEGARS